jgi:hypothetical protein
MKLELKNRFKGFRALNWHKNYLYASNGYALFRTEKNSLLETSDINREEVGFFEHNFIRNLGSKNRMSARLLRSGFQNLAFYDDKIIAIIDKHIAVLEKESKKFKPTFKIIKGTRPLGMAATPDGNIYWGEYFNNKEREPVSVYRSKDGGYSWEVIYTFPEGTIRHIHNMFYDSFDDSLWILTGDEDSESKILKTDRNFNSIEVIFQRNQQSRAATMIIEKDYIYYATDTPYEQNYIYRIERKTGQREKLAEISGPSMYSCKAGKMYFFSSAAEPGECYYPAACVWGSSDGDKWHKLIEWTKDRWHPGYFQFGNVFLPKGTIEDKILAMTGAAVREIDGDTLIWKVIL